MCLPGDQSASMRASATMSAPGICCNTAPVCELVMVAIVSPVAASTRKLICLLELARFALALSTALWMSCALLDDRVPFAPLTAAAAVAAELTAEEVGLTVAALTPGEALMVDGPPFSD